MIATLTRSFARLMRRREACRVAGDMPVRLDAHLLWDVDLSGGARLRRPETFFHGDRAGR